MRSTPRQLGQPDELEHLADPPPALLLVHSRREPQAEGHVLGDVEVGEQRVALEHRVDGPPLGRRARHVDAVDQDLAAVGTLEAADQAERRGLAAPGRAEEGEELPRRDLQIDAPEHGLRAELLAERDKADGAPPAGPIVGRRVRLHDEEHGACTNPAWTSPSATGGLLTDQSVGTRYDEAMRRTDPRPTTLPGRDYTSQEVFDLERERIFHRGWYYIGRSDPIGPGDRLVVDVAGESVLVVRDRDGALRAHANVCRHRGARLCDESGTGATGFDHLSVPRVVLRDGRPADRDTERRPRRPRP